MRCILTNGNDILEYPYSIDRLLSDNPNTSFPSAISREMMAEFGVYEVRLVDPPAVDHTKNLSEGVPIFQGEWIQTWEIKDASQAEIDMRVRSAWDGLRSERNYRLSETDWTQGKDISDDVSAVWASYRQELRDLPQNTLNPFSPIWPVKPE